MFASLRKSAASAEVTMRKARKATYTEPLKDKNKKYSEQELIELKLFLTDFYSTIYKRRGECNTIVMTNRKTVGKYFEELVPRYVTFEDFWQRYFWRCDAGRIVLEWDRQAAQQKQQMIASATSASSMFKGFGGGGGSAAVVNETADATEVAAESPPDNIADDDMAEVPLGDDSSEADPFDPEAFLKNKNEASSTLQTNVVICESDDECSNSDNDEATNGDIELEPENAEHADEGADFWSDFKLASKKQGSSLTADDSKESTNTGGAGKRKVPQVEGKHVLGTIDTTVAVNEANTGVKQQDSRSERMQCLQSGKNSRKPLDTVLDLDPAVDYSTPELLLDWPEEGFKSKSSLMEVERLDKAKKSVEQRTSKTQPQKPIEEKIAPPLVQATSGETETRAMAQTQPNKPANVKDATIAQAASEETTIQTTVQTQRNKPDQVEAYSAAVSIQAASKETEIRSPNQRQTHKQIASESVHTASKEKDTRLTFQQQPNQESSEKHSVSSRKRESDATAAPVKAPPKYVEATTSRVRKVVWPPPKSEPEQNQQAPVDSSSQSAHARKPSEVKRQERLSSSKLVSTEKPTGNEDVSTMEGRSVPESTAKHETQPSTQSFPINVPTEEAAGLDAEDLSKTAFYDGPIKETAVCNVVVISILLVATIVGLILQHREFLCSPVPPGQLEPGVYATPFWAPASAKSSASAAFCWDKPATIVEIKEDAKTGLLTLEEKVADQVALGRKRLSSIRYDSGSLILTGRKGNEIIPAPWTDDSE